MRSCVWRIMITLFIDSYVSMREKDVIIHDGNMNRSISDNKKMYMLIGLILLVGGLFFGLFTWLLIMHKWWLLIIAVCFFVLMSISSWISRKWRGRFADIINKAISVPVVMVLFLIGIIQPFITIIGTFLFVALYAFGFPALILLICTKVGWLELRPETIAFVVIALGSMLCSTLYDVTKWIIRISPLKNWGEHKYESYREQLAIYLIHPNNVVFLMYLIYFVYLGVSGYIQIQNGTFVFSAEFDVAILRAFLVFIAYTNVRSKMKETEVDAKELLKRTLLLFVHDDE